MARMRARRWSGEIGAKPATSFVCPQDARHAARGDLLGERASSPLGCPCDNSPWAITAREGNLLAYIFLRLSVCHMGALSTGDMVAQKITAKVTERCAIAPLARWLGPPNARGRAAAITTLGVGYLFCTRQIPFVVPLQHADKEGFTLWLKQTVQALVDQSR
jgi:hypothetical protein